MKIPAGHPQGFSAVEIDNYQVKEGKDKKKIKRNEKEKGIIMNKEKNALTNTSPDAALKEFFSDNNHFAELFNSYMFGGKETITPDSLEDLDPDVSVNLLSKEFQKTVKRVRDVMKVSKTGEYYRILGIENQKAIHYAMPLRVMLYDALTYLQEINKIIANTNPQGTIPSIDEFLSGFRKEDKIHPCYTIVIYFGEKQWDGPKTLKEMVEMDPNDPLKRYFNDYPMHLICVNELDTFPEKAGDVYQLFAAISSIYRTGGKNLPKLLSDTSEKIVWIAALVTDSRKVFQKILEKSDHHEGRRMNMCEALERVLQEEREQGMEKGMEKANRNTAIKLLQMGMPVEQIKIVTGLEIEQIEKLKKEKETE